MFFALSDDTRIQLVEWLINEGAGTATDFASRLPLTRQAVTRHLSELEKSGLVKSRKSGRERVYRFSAQPLLETQSWIEERTARWDRSLNRLRSLLEEE